MSNAYLTPAGLFAAIAAGQSIVIGAVPLAAGDPVPGSASLGLSDVTPVVESGAGSAGDAALAARANHVHPAPTGLVELQALAVAIPTGAVADLGAATVGTALGAFTDPPAAGEMAALRTFVNALKTDAAADRAKVNALLAALRVAGIVTP